MTVQGDAAGALRAALREGIERPVRAAQKEGLTPEARRARARMRSWAASSTTASGSRWAT